MLGQQIGRYRLVEELGRGGMATVYRAEDQTLGRAVALKVLHTYFVDDPAMKQRFLREARAIAALRHRNVVEVHDYGAGDAATPPYLVTELVRGPSLAKFLTERGVPLAEVAAMMVLPVAEALAAAHRAGIVHRDVKPDNVLHDDNGRVVLTDFGIARMAGEGTMTATGALVGSPAYMSPEQARSDDVDARSDVFSLGTTLYHLATGKLPFPGKNPLSIINAILAGRYTPAAQANAGVPGELERVIQKCLRPVPAERYANGDEVAAALRAMLEPLGLTDVDAELRAYFAAPGEYNAKLIPRLIERGLEHARTAAQKGQAARALRACDRVLALDANNAEANRIVASLGTRSRAKLVIAVVGSIAAAGAIGLALISRAPASPPVVSTTPPPAVPPVAVARVAIDAAVEALPELLPAAEKHTRKKPPHVTAAVVPDAAAAVESAPTPAPPPPALARVTVRAIPYCRPLELDGKALSPPYAISTTPGAHKLRCVHPARTRELPLELVSGANPEIVVRVFDDARIDASALAGELFVDGKRCAGSCAAPVGAIALELRKGAQVLESKPMFDLPPGTCRLAAGPLRCLSKD